MEFGTSGFLYRSNKLMYDRGTGTLWHQFRGVPAVGTLVGSGMKLEVLPMTLTLWSDWLADHPDTTVLDLETGVYPADSYASESVNSSSYFAYRSLETTMFPVPDRSEELDTKDHVFGLVFGDEARAYPISSFEGSTVINDTLGGQNVVIVSDSAGVGIRAYDRGQHVFTLNEGGNEGERSMTLTDESGADWLAEEDALVSLSGSAQPLARLASRDAYWFGWYAFYPQTSVFSP